MNLKSRAVGLYVLYTWWNKDEMEEKALCHSKGEQICRRYLEGRFKVPFPKVRPEGWLINPRTGRALELDCFNAKMRLAVEYDGVAHRKFTRAFHKSAKDF